MTNKDQIFINPLQEVRDFKFDQKVVEVFPDMIERSVPGYKTIIEGIGEIATRFVQDNSNIYDLGCSLGAASFSVRQAFDNNTNLAKLENCSIKAIDNSQAMVEKCRLIQQAYNFSMPIEVFEDDITRFTLENASFIILNFTLQFLPLEERQTLINKIYSALKPNGVLILSEKLSMQHSSIDQHIIELHHDFKRNNGYSDMEIAQKRAALENVLRPDSREIHFNRFSEAGFSQFDSWFQHYNFSSFIAIK